MIQEYSGSSSAGAIGYREGALGDTLAPDTAAFSITPAGVVGHHPDPRADIAPAR